MSVADDISSFIKQWPFMRRVAEMPAEFDALKKRVEELEAKIGAKHVPDVCKYCGEQAVRLSASLGPNTKGKIQEHWTCGECTRIEVRMV